jgi:GTP-binding protein YchF
MKIGFVGLPQSGKTTVFTAVCPHHQESHIGAAKMEVSRGIVKVADERVYELAKIYQPRKISLAEIEFMDVAGVSGKKGDAQRSEKDIPPALREPEVLAHVVRAFKDEIVIHPDGSVDPDRDVENVEAEFIFNDFILTESRLERISRQARLAGDENAKREMKTLEKVKAHLEAEKPLRTLELNPDEAKLIKGFQFLSQKPKLIILNVGEEDIPRMQEIEKEYSQKYAAKDVDVVAICARIQAELVELEEEDRKVFMQDMGLSQSALEKLIHKSFDLLGLLTFFTGGDKEVHAWTIPQGTKAPQAAGTIHNDFEKGFIKAEIFSYDELVKYGSEAEAKKHGCLRLEGKDYIVKDGDVILFRFNI